ncbi:MAG: LexA family protein [Peptostreptococcaceae bacterium]
MNKPEKPLNKNQLNILKIIYSFTNEKGYPPTMREIQNLAKIKSTSTIHDNINKLIKIGYLKNDPTKPRTAMVTEKYLKLINENNNSDTIIKNIESTLKNLQTTITTSNDPTLKEVNLLLEKALIKIKDCR